MFFIVMLWWCMMGKYFKWSSIDNLFLMSILHKYLLIQDNVVSMERNVIIIKITWNYALSATFLLRQWYAMHFACFKVVITDRYNM